MIQVRITTNTARKTVTVEPTQTLMDAFDAAGVSVGNAVVYVDGMVVNANEQYDTLTEIGVEDESTIQVSAIVKADSAV